MAKLPLPPPSVGGMFPLRCPGLFPVTDVTSADLKRLGFWLDSISNLILAGEFGLPLIDFQRLLIIELHRGPPYHKKRPRVGLLKDLSQTICSKMRSHIRREVVKLSIARGNLLWKHRSWYNVKKRKSIRPSLLARRAQAFLIACSLDRQGEWFLLNLNRRADVLHRFNYDASTAYERSERLLSGPLTEESLLG